MDKKVFEIYIKAAEYAFSKMQNDPENIDGSFEHFLIRAGSALAASEIAVFLSVTPETREDMKKSLDLLKAGIELHKERRAI